MAGQNSASPLAFVGVSSTVATLTANSPNLGDRITVGGVDYVFVYNAAANSEVYPGYGMTVNAAATNYSCTVSTVTTTDVCIGVVKNATIATGYYGWIATRGFTKVVMHADQSATSGDYVGIGVNGVFLKHVTSAASDVAMGHKIGKFPVSIASGGSGTAYIKTF